MLSVAARKAYNKVYYEAHKEDRKAYQKTYDEAHKEDRKAYYEAYYEALMSDPVRRYFRNERGAIYKQIRKKYAKTQSS